MKRTLRTTAATKSLLANVQQRYPALKASEGELVHFAFATLSDDLRARRVDHTIFQTLIRFRVEDCEVCPAAFPETSSVVVDDAHYEAVLSAYREGMPNTKKAPFPFLCKLSLLYLLWKNRMQADAAVEQDLDETDLLRCLWEIADLFLRKDPESLEKSRKICAIVHNNL